MYNYSRVGESRVPMSNPLAHQAIRPPTIHDTNTYTDDDAEILNVGGLGSQELVDDLSSMAQRAVDTIELPVPYRWQVQRIKVLHREGIELDARIARELARKVAHYRGGGGKKSRGVCRIRHRASSLAYRCHSAWSLAWVARGPWRARSFWACSSRNRSESRSTSGWTHTHTHE